MQEISKRSVVNLVDLEGSERAAKTGNTGEALAGGRSPEWSTRGLPRVLNVLFLRDFGYFRVLLKYLGDRGVS
jgi:hypothetical protein